MQGEPPVPNMDLSRIPLMPPPPGHSSDFTKRASYLTFLIIVTAITIPLQMTFLSSRFVLWAGRCREKWKPEDWCATMTTLVTISLNALCLVIVKTAGRHSWDVSVAAFSEPQFKRTYAVQIVFASISAFFGKLCFLTMYYRIFGHIYTVKVQLYAVGLIIIPILFPIPVVAQTVQPILAVALSALLTTTDLIILYIPIPHLIELNLSRGKKIGVLAMFLTGIFAIVVDSVSFYYRIQNLHFKDPVAYGFLIAVLCIIESSLSVVLSSVPAASKLIRTYVLTAPIIQSLLKSSSKSDEKKQTLPSFARRFPSTIKISSHRSRWDPYSTERSGSPHRSGR